MIDYDSFHSYLVELVGLYQRAHTTKGMSDLARRHHCAGLTRDQFYQMKLDKLTPEQVTPQLSRVIRDTIGRSDAKAVLRESIGALNEGILAGSRVSQGSDRTVQITITQPAQASATQQARRERSSSPLPLYKPGWIVFRKGGMMHLVSRLLDGDRFTWNYTLMRGDDGQEYITEEHETSSSWLGNVDIRRAKGPETARFVGALERGGYAWRVDNPNGLFIVIGKKKPAEGKPVEVFASDMPFSDYADTGIRTLPVVTPSPYRYALGPMLPIDNGYDLMARAYETPLLNAVVRQIRSAFPNFDHIREMFQYDMPTLCCSEEIGEYRVALVKDDNNGTCYWLAHDRDVLRLLAWISFINS